MKFKRIDQFQIWLILEAKSGDDLLSKFSRFKQMKVTPLHEETSEIEKDDFVGCYATGPKDWRRNINVYPNICSHESSFLFNHTV